MCIYKFESKSTGKVYIGSTTNFVTRLKQHLKDLRTHKHCNKRLQRHFDVYSVTDFTFSIIELFSDKDLMLQAEKNMIKNCKNLFNIKGEANSLDQIRKEIVWDLHLEGYTHTDIAYMFSLK